MKSKTDDSSGRPQPLVGAPGRQVVEAEEGVAEEHAKVAADLAEEALEVIEQDVPNHLFPIYIYKY